MSVSGWEVPRGLPSSASGFGSYRRRRQSRGKLRPPFRRLLRRGSLSPRRGRRDVGNRCVGQTVEGDFLPGALLGDQLAQQLVVERMSRFVAAEFTDQAVSQQI